MPPNTGLKKPPYILQAAKFYPPIKGGIERVIERIVTSLSNKIAMQVLSTTPGGLGRTNYYQHDKITRTLSLGKLFSTPIAPFYPLQLYRLARKAAAVAIHLPYPVIDASVLLALPKSIPLIVHYHADITKQARVAKFLSPLLSYTLKRADYIILSNPAFIEYSPWLKPHHNRCHVVPFSIDAQAWQEKFNKNTIEEIKHRYGDFILAVGRLVPYKGFNYLIEAVATLPDTKLVIVGEGSEHEKLLSLARRLGVEARVNFVVADDSLLPNFYCASQLVVLPSTDASETFGIVQIEAMASSKAIVNTNIASGVPWVARDGIEALTIPPRNSKALAEAIKKLLAEPELMIQYGKAGFNRVTEAFTPEAEFSRLHQLYMQAINKS